MEMAIFSSFFKNRVITRNLESVKKSSNLTNVTINVPYTIKSIKAEDKDMENFLFTLGCYEGEKITVISVLAENYIINIKDARYSIDEELAKAILI